MNEGCTPELMLAHSSKLGEHEQALSGMREDVNRHEKIYDILIGMSSTQSQMLTELTTQGKVLGKVIDDVEFLKENAENRSDTKESLDRVWTAIDDINGEVDIVKAQDGNEAIKMIKQLKWLVISILVSGIGAMIWNQIMA